MCIFATLWKDRFAANATRIPCRIIASNVRGAYNGNMGVCNQCHQYRRRLTALGYFVVAIRVFYRTRVSRNLSVQQTSGNENVGFAVERGEGGRAYAYTMQNQRSTYKTPMIYDTKTPSMDTIYFSRSKNISIQKDSKREISVKAKRLRRQDLWRQRIRYFHRCII